MFMFRKMMLGLTVVIVSGLMLSGCGTSSKKLSMNYAAKQTVGYESTSTMIKDVEFDQPSLKKDKKDQTSTVITVKFDQTIAEVGQDGTAIADVTIKGIRCKMVNKNEVRFEFDSASEKGKSDPLNNLVGQSYRISLSPSGAVKVVDAAKARAVTINGEGQRLTQILSDESILERHQLPLPSTDKTITITPKGWTQVTPSPPGLLAPKMFNKTYTVNQTGKNNTTVVTMSAKENLAQKPAEDPKASGNNLGFLTKLFDNNDDYTGKLVVNLSSGVVNSYEETLVSAYTAQDKPKDAAADTAPDTLIMRLTYSHSLKKID
jgi:hypothetical protein